MLNLMAYSLSLALIKFADFNGYDAR
jgi:hypothetical protein